MNKTAAYQIKRGMNRDSIFHDCYRLHNGIDEPIWSFIDSSDPSIGVRLKYTSGDWCEAALKNREFSLEFYCDEMVENIPDRKEEIIYEDETCSYILPIYTSYGCPIECPISSNNNQLCDGHGICEFDFTNLKPKCYCYYGYCGDDCSNTNCDPNSNLLYNITAPNDDESCLFELIDSFGIKSYYNLSYFNLNNEVFVVDDMLDREYVYKFNICGDIDNFFDETIIPSSCTNYNHGPCTYFKKTEYSYKNETTTTKYCDNTYDTFSSKSSAKAVQLYYPTNNKSEPMCYWLGMDVPNFDMPSFNVTLLDQNDTGRGVIFKIQNGQYCDEGERNRELNVQLRCPDTRGFDFDPQQEAKSIINESILESETCIYNIELESPLACPLQCISKSSSSSSKFSVCSSHGICASDPQAMQVRCICDDGYSGITCNLNIATTTLSPSTNDNNKSGKGLGIGLGVGISLVLIGVIGVFIYLHIKKKREVGQYGNMLGDENLVGDDGVESAQ